MDVLIMHKVLRGNIITSISFIMGKEGSGRGLTDDKIFFWKMNRDYEGIDKKTWISNNVKSICKKYADIKNIKHTKSKLELSPEVNEIEMQKIQHPVFMIFFLKTPLEIIQLETCENKISTTQFREYASKS